MFTYHNCPNRGIYPLTAVPYEFTQFYDITIPLRPRYTLYPTYLLTYLRFDARPG